MLKISKKMHFKETQHATQSEINKKKNYIYKKSIHTIHTTHTPNRFARD